jgi:hypothetical protein
MMLVAFTVVGWPLVGSSRRTRRETGGGSAWDRLIAQRDAAYRAIRDLDFEYELGNLSESDYRGLRERYRDEAAVALRKLDAVGSGSSEASPSGPATSTEAASPDSPQADLACPSCSRPTGAGDRYCWSCGEQLVDRCPKCGVSVRTGDRFCAGCGDSLENEA